MGTGRRPCPGLWKTPVIRWDGQLTVCCADVRGQIEVGNVAEADFDTLWNGPRMTRYRIWHILGQFDRMPLCAGCGGINFYRMTDDEIRAYLARIGRLDLFPRYLARMKEAGE